MKSGALSPMKRFAFDLRDIVRRQALPGYATALNSGDAKGAPPPERLIPPMIERFIATDRSYAKNRRATQPG
jgi:hypothetical protein